MESKNFSQNPRLLPALNKFSIGVLWNIVSLRILGLGGLLLSMLVVHFRDTYAVGVFNQVYAIYFILSRIGVGGLQFSLFNHISHN
ncbi:MAG: hypothetical protein AB9891_15730 [Anaerolineaceae bacterium]